MLTLPSTDVDLGHVTDDVEPCYVCSRFEITKESTGYIEYADSCCGHPNPAPLCESHYTYARNLLYEYGSEHWDCPECGRATNVVSIYRRTR